MTGPDRETDHAIHAIAVAPHLYDHIMWPSYTGSVDAAMTLVPEGLGFCVGRPLPKYCAGWYAEIFAEGWGAANPHLLWTDSQSRPRGKDDYRPNPAIALCIAALRARQTEGS